MSAKSKAVAFSHDTVPPNVKDDCFDVFDDTFEAHVSDAAADDDVCYESEAYNTFLRGDGQSGELTALKNEWMRRMRLDIITVEKKFQKDREVVRKWEASSGDPKDATYGRAKFITNEADKDRAAMAIDTEEGHVSEFEAVRPIFSNKCTDSNEDISFSFQSDREILHSAAEGIRQVTCC